MVLINYTEAYNINIVQLHEPIHKKQLLSNTFLS